MLGARYNPDNQELAMKDSQLEEIFTSARDALSNFVISLPAHEQPYIVQESILPFLKNLEAIKAYCDRNPNSNPDDQEEEDDTNTIINGGNNAAEENPDGQEGNPGDDDPNYSPRQSPRNLLTSSKSLKIEGKSYQIKKQRIDKLLNEIEENSSLHHSEHLEKQAARLPTMLNKMDI